VAILGMFGTLFGSYWKASFILHESSVNFKY